MPSEAMRLKAEAKIKQKRLSEDRRYTVTCQQIYQQGRDAALQGKGCDANPYHPDSIAYLWWFNGYRND